MLRGLVRHSQNFALPSGAFEQNGSIIKLTYAGENATEPVLFDAAVSYTHLDVYKRQ